jgi:hypothetical protein
MNVAVPQDRLRIESGSPRRYEDHSGASGKAFYRFFCGDRGSHIYSHGAAYGAIAFIKAGTLDDPSWVAPKPHIWCAEKLPGSTFPRASPRHPRIRAEKDRNALASSQRNPSTRLPDLQAWPPSVCYRGQPRHPADSAEGRRLANVEIADVHL